MIEPAKALQDSLTKMANAIHKDQYRVASFASTDFIKLSYHLECRDELFIGEVLEAIFTQIYHMMETHIIPDKDRADIKDMVNGHMDKLLEAYSKRDGAVYEVLRDVRYGVTKLQFDADYNYKLRRRHNIRERE